VIDKVDESLSRLIKRYAVLPPDVTDPVEVRFEAPTKEWASKRNTPPTINVYLYDIREDLDRREVEYEEIRDEKNNRVIERRPPLRRYLLSYLVTVWTPDAKDEHRLLSRLLACFVKHEQLPKDVLSEELAGQPYAIRTTVALPPPQDRALSDVWSALGGELKPSLDLVVTAPFDAGRVLELATPVEVAEFTVHDQPIELHEEKPPFPVTKHDEAEDKLDPTEKYDRAIETRIVKAPVEVP
jgi:hypothetical protein